jgi:hypothetical protein
MCDVHFIPDVDEMRFASKVLPCMECPEPIPVGDEYRYQVGVLDEPDLTGVKEWLYIAHEDCFRTAYWDTDAIEENGGCFRYAGMQPAVRCETCKTPLGDVDACPRCAGEREAA